MGAQYKIIGVDGREYEATLEDLRVWIAEGRVGPSTWIWKTDEGRWRTASAWPELRWDIPEPPPLLPAMRPNPSPAAAEIAPRISAFVVDLLALGALFSLVTMPWATHLDALNEAAMSESTKSIPDIGVVLQFYMVFLGVLLPLRIAYSVAFISALGGTPGKLLFGLKVVDAEGGPIGPPQTILRCFAEWLSVGSLGIGYVIAVITPQRRALHDLVAGTRVVHQAAEAEDLNGS